MPTIDTDVYSKQLRERSIRPEEKKILIATLGGSKQEGDITEGVNCSGLGRIHHFRLGTPDPWPSNPLPTQPASQKLGIAEADMMKAQVFQVASCNWRCWYCFVPYDLLSGNAGNGEWVTAEQLVTLYVEEPNRPLILDCSGGQPDLVPEWIPWMMEALTDRGLNKSVYLWSDDNLSNDYLWRHLTPAQLQGMARYPMYGRVACFKGFDDASFAFNTKADPSLFDRQFELFSRLIRLRLDLYAYATFTAPTADGLSGLMRDFVDRLQSVHPNLPLRLVPLRVEGYGVTRSRMRPAHDLALRYQEEAILLWNAELAARFTESERAVPMAQVEMEP
jgi:uncharacterized Fe-S cluster-containing radical SAM superfamily protein